MKSKKPIVVILGMHRSGTSLLANFMQAIGVDLGDDLVPADQWNVAGHFESRKIAITHEKIMKELNCDWHNPPLRFDADWWRKPGVQALKKELVDFVRSECERTEKIWGFKDPRTAILFPVWEEIFEELQLEPVCILAVRHPSSVAGSLSTRNRFASSHSEALWLKTNLEVLSHARDHLRAIVNYDNWFSSGLDQARTLINSLRIFPSIDEAQLTEAVNQVIQKNLRHHSAGDEAICSPIVAKFYNLLCEATTDAEIPGEISEITTTFEKSMDLLTIWDGMVAERDSIIDQRNTKIEALRKQRKLLIQLIILIVIVFAIISSFMLLGGRSWF
jgi:hypothetical protein